MLKSSHTHRMNSHKLLVSRTSSRHDVTVSFYRSSNCRIHGSSIKIIIFTRVQIVHRVHWGAGGVNCHRALFKFFDYI